MFSNAFEQLLEVALRLREIILRIGPDGKYASAEELSTDIRSTLHDGISS